MLFQKIIVYKIPLGEGVYSQLKAYTVQSPRICRYISVIPTRVQVLATRSQYHHLESHFLPLDLSNTDQSLSV